MAPYRRRKMCRTRCRSKSGRFKRCRRCDRRYPVRQARCRRRRRRSRSRRRPRYTYRCRSRRGSFKRCRYCDRRYKIRRPRRRSRSMSLSSMSTRTSIGSRSTTSTK